MSNNYVIDSDENSDFMYNLIEKVCTEIGPRMPCSENEIKASNMMAEELKNYCDEVEIEEFETYPRALYAWIKPSIVFAAVALLIFLLSDFNLIIVSLLSLGIIIFVLVMIIKHLILYDVFIMKYWPLFKKKKSQNAIGVIKPKGEVKKRVVFSGHIDSAARFNIMHYFRDGYLYCLIVALVSIVSFIVLYTVGLIKGILELLPFDITTLANVLILLLTILVLLEPFLFAAIVLVLGRSEKVFYGIFKKIEPVAIVFVIAMTFYSILIEFLLWPYLWTPPSLISASVLLFLNGLPGFLILYFGFASKKHAVMGATDNLTAVAATMCIAKILKDWKTSYPEIYPENTEVVFGILGSEEPGCRGAEAFAIKHKAEYNKIDTTCVNMESLNDSSHQVIFDKEGTLDLDPKIYNLLGKCCEELGYKYKIVHCPPIAGGTDARGFAKYGLKASALCGLIFKDWLHYYHTDRDNMKIINKERKPLEDSGTSWKDRNIRGAMEMAVKICLKYLEKKDKT